MAQEMGTDCYLQGRATALQISVMRHHGMAAASSRQVQQHAYCWACCCGAGRCLMVAVQSHLHCFQEHLWGVMRREVGEVIQKDGKADC